MKTVQSNSVQFLITALFILGASIGTTSLAQTMAPLTCGIPQPTVNVNRAAVFTASGGNGSYVWSGPNLNVTNSSGTRFSVSYPDPGVYTITLSSAGTSVPCPMIVVAANVSTGDLMCSPALQNVVLGQTVSMLASGGDGTYTWSSPDIIIDETRGSGFTANYASTGLKNLTVESDNQTAICRVNVLSSGTPVFIPPTPGFPNTGGGFNK